MAHNVEGQWKNFTFKMIQPNDMPAVHEHLRNNFLRHERTCELVGFSQDFADDFEQVFQWAYDLNENLSFIAVDNDNGKIAALRMTHTKKKAADEFANFVFKSDATKLIFKMFAILEGPVDVFEHYGVDRYAFYLAASVDKDYRNQGLASEMYRRSEALLRDRKIPVVESIFTNPFSRKCADKLGFEELSVVYYKGLKDENGEIMFPGALDGDHAAMKCKRLS